MVDGYFTPLVFIDHDDDNDEDNGDEPSRSILQQEELIEDEEQGDYNAQCEHCDFDIRNLLKCPYRNNFPNVCIRVLA